MFPNNSIQSKSVNKAIACKMGKVKLASKTINQLINYLTKQNVKIILGCTELPIAIFAHKPFKTMNHQKYF